MLVGRPLRAPVRLHGLDDRNYTRSDAGCRRDAHCWTGDGPAGLYKCFPWPDISCSPITKSTSVAPTLCYQPPLSARVERPRVRP